MERLSKKFSSEMSVNISRRRALFAMLGYAIAGPMLINLSGCSKSDKNNSNDPAMPTLSLQASWVNDAEFIGYFIALSQGMYQTQGLNLNYLPGAPDKIADIELFAKNAEIALTNPETTVNAIIKQNAPFKIIGTQYQKSPLGIVSLKKNKITSPQDLIGKKVAVPAANDITFEAFLKLNKIAPESVTTVPYAYDPRPLVEGRVDATVDFVNNVRFAILSMGQEPSFFLFYDYGFRVFMDTIVVREETLLTNRKELVAFLRASRKGWEENFKDPTKYPAELASTFFSSNGRSTANEIYFNRNQQSLIESPNGILSMSEQDILSTIEALQRIGLDARRDMFVTDLLSEI